VKIAFISTMSGFTPNVPRWAACEELWGAAALHLARAGAATIGVNVFRWPEKVPQIEVLAQAGCRVQLRHTFSGLARLAPRLPGRLHSRWLSSFAPDLAVINHHQFHTEPEWAGRCQKSRLPYVLAVHGVDETLTLDEPYRRRLAENYRRARRCYFLSHRNRAAVERALGTPLENAALVRNPYKVPHHDPPPWPSLENGVALGFVARVDALKGHELLLEVLAQEKWRGRPLRVDCFGMGERLSDMANQAYKQGLRQVAFHGFTADLRAVWARCHALLLPSRTEGLPLTVVEAMLCERPVIATEVGGIAELVQDGVTGFLAPTPTVADLDAALERAWQRRDQLQAMGQAAGAHARKVIPADPGAVFARELLTLLHAAN
jgi:glycosyltransferase involved in cell wall biosynthesis